MCNPLEKLEGPEESVHKKMHVFTLGKDHETRFDKASE